MEPRSAAFDFESAFQAHYGRIARAIARVIRDPGRAEELAVEVLWKFWRTPSAHGEQAGGWLYRTAVRVGLNELRRRVRGERHESLAEVSRGTPGPEEVRAAREEQERCGWCWRRSTRGSRSCYYCGRAG
jgi:RNA polymerase sigma-70 factor (ECF subfamily)